MNTIGIQTAFKVAVRDLTEFIVHRTQGINFVVANKTTDSFKKFKEESTRDGFITVSLEGCDNSIYGNVYINVLARVWHDEIHLKHNLNFMEFDETIVAKVQQEEVFQFIKAKYGCTRAYYASKLIWIDIYEQVVYYRNTKEFVENQYEFVFNKFKELF